MHHLKNAVSITQAGHKHNRQILQHVAHTPNTEIFCDDNFLYIYLVMRFFKASSASGSAMDDVLNIKYGRCHKGVMGDKKISLHHLFEGSLPHYFDHIWSRESIVSTIGGATCAPTATAAPNRPTAPKIVVGFFRSRFSVSYGWWWSCSLKETSEATHSFNNVDSKSSDEKFSLQTQIKEEKKSLNDTTLRSLHFVFEQQNCLCNSLFHQRMFFPSTAASGWVETRWRRLIYVK